MTELATPLAALLEEQLEQEPPDPPELTGLPHDPTPTLRALGEALRLEDEHEGIFNAVLDDLGDGELLRVILVVHDVARGLANGLASGRGSKSDAVALKRLLRVQTSAGLVAFVRFARDPFADVFGPHIEWLDAMHASQSEWGLT